MAVTSFIVSAGIVATGISVYTNKDQIKESITEQVIDSVSEILPGLIGGLGMGSDLAPSMPDAPSTPTTTDLSIPGF